MTGEKKNSDLSSRLHVKRGGKLISKTLGKSASPPSISAPPKAVVGASKVKKDEVQRHKNSFHDILRGSTRDHDGSRSVSLNAPASNLSSPSANHGDSADPIAANTIMPAVQNNELEKLYVSDDGRVARLEKALADARDEIVVSRRELERAKASKNQATEACRQATPDSVIQERLNGGDSEPQLQRHGREEDLIEQNQALRCRLAELQDQLIAQSEQQPPNPTHSQADWDALIFRLHEAEKDSHVRLQHLLLLKSSISSLTRTDSQVSDSELAESFAQLANRVREWVVSNYRRTTMDFYNLPDPSTRTLQTIKVDFEKIEGADKLALYQAVVSQILMRIFAEPVAIGMPGRGMWAGVRGFALGIQDAGTYFHEWRRATLRVLEKSGQEPSLSQWKTEQVELLSHELECIMKTITCTGLTTGARLTLVGILNTATDLQRTLCLQKAQYRVLFFGAGGQQHEFDTRTMEPVNDLEYTFEEDCDHFTERRQFDFCVFPGLEKLNDGIATCPDLGSIVSKARVCCGVG